MLSFILEWRLFVQFFCLGFCSLEENARNKDFFFLISEEKLCMLVFVCVSIFHIFRTKSELILNEILSFRLLCEIDVCTDRLKILFL